MPRIQWRLSPSLVVASLLVGCTAPPEVAAASCEDVAHQVAEVLVESVDAKANEFDAAAQTSESEVPILEPKAGDRGVFATATTIADGTEAGASLQVRIEALEQAAGELECGEDGWSNPVVAADLTKDLERRYEVLDGEPTTEEYVALNFLATLLVVMEGKVEGTEP